LVTVLPLILCVFIYAYKLGVLKSGAFFFNIIVALFIGTLSFSEGALLTPELFFVRLDEITFYEESIRSAGSIFNEHWRYLGYIIFSHFTYLTGGEYFFKIQSIPFALLSSLILYDVTRKKISLWLFPVVFSYILFLSTLHMRDAMIIFGILFFVLRLSRCKRSTSIFLWTSVASVYFLTIRFEFSIIIFLIGIWLVIVNNYKIKPSIAFFYPSLGLVILFIVPYTATFLINISNYFFPGRAELYLMLREDEVTSFPLLNENASSLLRQLLTPIPTSLIGRIFGDEIPANLYLSDLFRLLLMVFVYFTTFLLLFYYRKVLVILRKEKFPQILLLFSVIVSILYSIFGDGGGDTRNKVYPFILLFYLFVMIFRIRLKTF